MKCYIYPIFKKITTNSKYHDSVERRRYHQKPKSAYEIYYDKIIRENRGNYGYHYNPIKDKTDYDIYYDFIKKDDEFQHISSKEEYIEWIKPSLKKQINNEIEKGYSHRKHPEKQISSESKYLKDMDSNEHHIYLDCTYENENDNNEIDERCKLTYSALEEMTKNIPVDVKRIEREKNGLFSNKKVCKFDLTFRTYGEKIINKQNHNNLSNNKCNNKCDDKIKFSNYYFMS